MAKKDRKDPFDRFLDSSPIAGTVRLTPRIVVERSKMSLKEIDECAEHGTKPVPRITGRELDLEVGGQLFGRGKIVTEEGKLFFELSEIIEGGKDGDT
jgi:flagellar motor switch/type III secretory pathway protein FliN